MEQSELARVLAAKALRRGELARLPIEQKLLLVARLQQMAAPILEQRGKSIHCWSIEQLFGVEQP